MPDSRQRMNEYHPRPHIPHYFTDFFAVSLGIAVNFAFPAARFFIAFRAVVKPLMSVVEQITAIGA